MSLNVEPGDLLIFAGFYSLHRVTPVIGDTTRYVGTLCYKDRPNVMNSPEVQQLFYGRVNQGRSLIPKSKNTPKKEPFYSKRYLT